MNSPNFNFTVLIAAKLLGKQKSENYRALYGSAILVSHFGTPIWWPETVCKKDERFCYQSHALHARTSECFDYHFNLLALSEKHFKSAEMLVSIIFEIMLIESGYLQFVIWKTKHSSGTKVSPDV